MTDTSIDGVKLRALREGAGLSQPELADRSGVSQAHISRLEEGKRSNIKLSTVNKLANALGVPVSRLLAQGPIEMREPSMEYLLRQAQAQYEKIKPLSLPLVEQRAAAGYLGGMTAYTETIDYSPQEADRKHKLFAIRVSGTCLEPRLMDGHIAIVSQNAETSDGDIVLALHEGEAILKERRIIDGRLHLVALQGQAPIPINGDTRIVGKVIDATYGRKV